MRGGNVFNKVVFHRNDDLIALIRESYGFNKVLLNKFYERMENLNPAYNLFLNNNKYLIGFKFISKIVPKKSSITNKRLLNIYTLDLTTSYKGWRHMRNLPVHGQRT